MIELMRDESIMTAGGPGSVASTVYLNLVIKLNGIVLTRKQGGVVDLPRTLGHDLSPSSVWVPK